jgi:cytidylate kinase
LEDIEARDKRDSIRSVAPLKQSKGSSFIDTTLLNITEVVNKILKQHSEISNKSI